MRIQSHKECFPADGRGRLIRLRGPEIHKSQSAQDERARQLADLADYNGEEAGECAAADLSREFPGSPA